MLDFIFSGPELNQKLWLNVRQSKPDYSLSNELHKIQTSFCIDCKSITEIQQISSNGRDSITCTSALAIMHCSPV